MMRKNLLSRLHEWMDYHFKEVDLADSDSKNRNTLYDRAWEECMIGNITSEDLSLYRQYLFENGSNPYKTLFFKRIPRYIQRRIDTLLKK